MKIHALTYANPERMTEATAKNLDLLKRAAEEQGHVLEIIYARDCQLKFSNKKPELLIKNQKLQDINILLIRANFLGANLESYSAIIKQFQIANIPVINDHLAVVRAKNKVRTMQSLGRDKIPVPKTYVVISSEYIDDVIGDIRVNCVIVENYVMGKGVKPFALPRLSAGTRISFK